MIYSLESLRPNPVYPTYPPYHVGDYLEDYFYKKYLNEDQSTLRDFIAISWTTLYVQNQTQEIQPFLNSLDQNKKYFTILQHDDAPLHKLPKDTLCFGAGGNYQGNNVIPIPLICSPLNVEYTEQDRSVLVSFVGSNTHNIRVKIANNFSQKDDCFIYIKNWSPAVPQNDFYLFLDTAVKSKYMLCPRGYGLNSFRLYECFQLGCVPVIISDQFYLPWTDELNWDDFAVLIHENEIDTAYKKLKSIPDEKYKKMKQIGKEIYKQYFSMDGMYQNILKRLK